MNHRKNNAQTAKIGSGRVTLLTDCASRVLMSKKFMKFAITAITGSVQNAGKLRIISGHQIGVLLGKRRK